MSFLGKGVIASQTSMCTCISWVGPGFCISDKCSSDEDAADQTLRKILHVLAGFYAGGPETMHLKLRVTSKKPNPKVTLCSHPTLNIHVFSFLSCPWIYSL